MLGLQRHHQLLQSNSSSSCLSARGFSSHIRTASKLTLLRICCGAGKRHDHSSNAAADDGSGKRKQSNKQPKQHRGLNPHAMAPTEQVLLFHRVPQCRPCHGLQQAGECCIAWVDAQLGIPQQVANVVLSLSRLSMPPPPAAAAAAAAAAAPPPPVPPAISREVAELYVLQLLQGRLAQQLKRWSAQDVSSIMWACGKLHVINTQFFDKAAAAAPSWLPGAITPNLVQAAYACRILQYKDQQLMALIVTRSKQVQQQQQQQQQRRQQLKHDPHDTRRQQEDMNLAAVVGYAIAVLDMQQLAGDVRELVASSRVTPKSRLGSADAGMLWEVHAWLVQHQLLDGRGLAGL
ncbi:hypothetical protein COO60DRAFT_266345 [Scenedesmus sp. NREL 46B-D3]|nr:hypothetical protein COO60DRAFT_266345 [Scenedesmus sp. NREL 46B-D3]